MKLTSVNQRSNVGVGRHAIADAKLLGFVGTGGNELAVDTPLNVAAFD
jgi:hypothetical protein